MFSLIAAVKSSKLVKLASCSQHLSTQSRNMPAHVVLEPEGTTLVSNDEHDLLERLLPFTFAISGFRGKALSERGLLVHYKPQVPLLPTRWMHQYSSSVSDNHQQQPLQNYMAHHSAFNFIAPTRTRAF